MIATKYPNRDALYAAHTTYRDAMRRFISRVLKKDYDTSLEELIRRVAPSDLDNTLKLYNEIEAAIDIQNFPDFIITYWNDPVFFSKEFNADSMVRTETETIKKGRKLWAHPGLEDTAPENTRTLLSLISKVLGEIHELDEKRKVEVIRNQLFPYDSEERLAVMSKSLEEELTKLKKYQEATDKRLTVVEEHYTDIVNTLNQLRTVLEKPLESREHSKNEPNQPIETEVKPSLESLPLKKEVEVFSTLEVGQHLTGSVKRIINEGVFVALALDKGEGFIPRSELTLKPINHPSDVVKPDSEVEVIVIDLNQQNSEKLPTLRLKSKHDEWLRRVDEKGYNEGSKTQVTITTIHEMHGAFAELEEGISGLIHQSNMPSDLSKSLHVGKNIEVTISRVDREKEKIDFCPVDG